MCSDSDSDTDEEFKQQLFETIQLSTGKSEIRDDNTKKSLVSIYKRLKLLTVE